MIRFSADNVATSLHPQLANISHSLKRKIMDKTSIRFGERLQRVIRDDPDFWKEPTLQTAYAFIAFVTTMAASGKVPHKNFRSHECDCHMTSGLSPSPLMLKVLQETYNLSDRISVEIEIGLLPCHMLVHLNFYGSGKAQFSYLHLEGGIESDCVRKFLIPR
jgi:hypothetical protein